MSDCEFLEKCPFFNDRMPGMDDMAKGIKDRYCHGEFEKCARYRIFKELGRDSVPADLYLLTMSRVSKILSAASNG